MENQNFIYDYRNDHDGESGKKLAKNAVILFVVSLLLVLLSHFVLIGQKAKFTKEIPTLKENRQKLEKEVETLNGNLKHSEESYKKAEALIKIKQAEAEGIKILNSAKADKTFIGTFSCSSFSNLFILVWL